MNRSAERCRTEWISLCAAVISRQTYRGKTRHLQYFPSGERHLCSNSRCSNEINYINLMLEHVWAGNFFRLSNSPLNYIIDLMSVKQWVMKIQRRQFGALVIVTWKQCRPLTLHGLNVVRVFNCTIYKLWLISIRIWFFIHQTIR